MSSTVKFLMFFLLTGILTSCQFKANRDPADETSRRVRPQEGQQQSEGGEGRRTQEDRDEEQRREEIRRRADREDGYPTRRERREGTGGSTDSGSESNPGSNQSGGSYGGGGDSGNTPTN